MSTTFRLFLTLIFWLSIGNIFSQTSHPNILFIAVDDLNDWIGCMQDQLGYEDYPRAITPNMDRLAALGTLFLKCPLPGANLWSLQSQSHEWPTAFHHGHLWTDQRQEPPQGASHVGEYPVFARVFWGVWL